MHRQVAIGRRIDQLGQHLPKARKSKRRPKRNAGKVSLREARRPATHLFQHRPCTLGEWASNRSTGAPTIRERPRSCRARPMKAFSKRVRRPFRRSGAASRARIFSRRATVRRQSLRTAHPESRGYGSRHRVRIPQEMQSCDLLHGRRSSQSPAGSSTERLASAD